MATEQIARVIAEPDTTKSEVNDSIGPVDADPSHEVSRKRQSLSDLFTIVSARYLNS